MTETSDADESSLLVEPAGKFRIYLGAAAGVGKTVAMLDEGLRRLNRGTDVVIGIVETHHRPFTDKKVEGLEVVHRRQVSYRGREFEEFDLDLVLARRPEVVLVDELAHTNIPGSGRNAKRWQDVLEILDAGISVITTVNIQHVESLADAVETMTGAKVQERVPDWVVRRADQIELVDSSPEQLRRRLLHGNIYPSDKVNTALTHFFRYENLAALRELSLRFLADETEEEMLHYLSRVKSHGQWETMERIMVAVTGVTGSDQVLHRAARIAARSKSELRAIHVVQDDRSTRAIAENLETLKFVAASLGAHWVDLRGDDVAETLLNYARDERITQIVIGSTLRSRWSEMIGGSIHRKLMRAAAKSSIDVHIIARRSGKSDGSFGEENDYLDTT
ncbi:MAG: universal stress protein [Acidimicrobiaceae bacterium]|nr:universal stress protein [Acidimicrobiaceae bacterium]